MFCFRVRPSVFLGIVLSLEELRPDLDMDKALRSRESEPWFYLRLDTQDVGLMLLRVLRGGLRLGECLGVTHGRANDLLETAPRTLVREPESR